MRSLIFTFVIAVMLASTADAQTEPPAGVRATGMGGAFVAVADDASAVFWNPAGLASGSYFSLALDDNRLQTPDQTSFPHQRSAFMLAVGAPAVGLSYFSTTVTRAAAGTVSAGELVPGRRADGIFVERLAARHVGATVVQSVTRNLAIGATFRLVRGSASTGVVSTADTSAFDAAGDLFPKKSTMKFDGDVGLMLASTYAKAGITVRNVLEPAFPTPDGASIPLERRVRGGVSLLVRQTITVAADVDFTKASTSLGEWRDAAIGAEARAARRVWVRGGIHWNTAGGGSGPGAAPIASLGGSYAVYGSILADGQVSLGSENGDRGWGVGLRFVF
jgi:hypothetical protein